MPSPTPAPDLSYPKDQASAWALCVGSGLQYPRRPACLPYRPVPFPTDQACAWALCDGFGLLIYLCRPAPLPRRPGPSPQGPGLQLGPVRWFWPPHTPLLPSPSHLQAGTLPLRPRPVPGPCTIGEQTFGQAVRNWEKDKV